MSNNKHLVIKLFHSNNLVDKLKVLNPLLTIQRGYAVARSKGRVVSHAKDLNKDDEVELRFKDGKVNTRVL